MMFRKDAIEETVAYKAAMARIEPILDKEFENVNGMGTCHRYWWRKKELLKQNGIDWKSPSEMNPDIRFD